MAFYRTNGATIVPHSFVSEPYGTPIRDNPSRISYSTLDQKKSEIEAYLKYVQPIIDAE
ncbi:MAG: hypothetical protein WDA21_03705 [Bacilli bacterium]